MRAPVLIDLAFSSWSEKARWALDWKGVRYVRNEYTPMLGDLELLWRTGQTEVPVLVTEHGETIPDSTRIVSYLEEALPEPRLIPADARERADALRWQDWASDTLSPVGRALVSAGLASEPKAAEATVPPTAPWIVRATTAITASPGLWLFNWSYGIGASTIENARRRLPHLLEAIRGALAGGRRFLVGETFTVADLAVAAAFILLDPPPDDHLPRPMPAALRRAFTYRLVRREFPDLVAWRDQMYKEFRRPPAARSTGPVAAARAGG